MAGATNRGKLRELEWSWRSRAVPTNFYLAFVTDATAPGPDTNILSDLTEIAAGHGAQRRLGAGRIDARNGTFDTDVFVGRLLRLHAETDAFTD